MNWISVKEKLPKIPGNYWVYRKPVENWYSNHQMSVRQFDGEKWLTRQEVTHWMILPEPPAKLNEG